MKKDAFYFPHFSNARHDRKLKRVQKDLGIEGYGIYFMLLEVLREQMNFKYPLSDIDLLADEFGCSEVKIKGIISQYELFDIDESNNFFSNKMLVYLEPYFRMKEQRRIAGKASAEKRLLNGCSTAVQQSKEKESKVKEKKIKKTKEFIKPTLAEVEEFFISKGFNKQYAKQAFDFYDITDWVDSRGNKVLNWKQKMNGIWLTEEKRTKANTSVTEINKSVTNPLDEILEWNGTRMTRREYNKIFG